VVSSCMFPAGRASSKCSIDNTLGGFADLGSGEIIEIVLPVHQDASSWTLKQAKKPGGQYRLGAGMARLWPRQVPSALRSGPFGRRWCVMKIPEKQSRGPVENGLIDEHGSVVRGWPFQVGMPSAELEGPDAPAHQPTNDCPAIAGRRGIGHRLPPPCEREMAD